VVEGWLPHYALEKAYIEFQKNNYNLLITTGIKHIPEYFKMSDNGFLIFYTSYLLAGQDKNGQHRIVADAYSDMGGENKAHFNLYINDSPAANFYAERRKKGYGMNWNGNLKDIDSIMIMYDNDIWEPNRDRNLSIKDIRIDDTLVIPYLYHSEYDMLKLDGKLRWKNNITSTAQFARARLMDMGINSLRILAVSSEKVRINRTLTSALAFREWLVSNGESIHSINIVTLGPHARRTWMTYNKILKGKYNIGIISIPDSDGQTTRTKRALNTLRETFGILYYWVILQLY
jgi:hypothetical protein